MTALIWDMFVIMEAEDIIAESEVLLEDDDIITVSSNIAPFMRRNLNRVEGFFTETLLSYSCPTNLNASSLARKACQHGLQDAWGEGLTFSGHFGWNGKRRIRPGNPIFSGNFSLESAVPFEFSTENSGFSRQMVNTPGDYEYIWNVSYSSIMYM